MIETKFSRRMIIGGMGGIALYPAFSSRAFAQDQRQESDVPHFFIHCLFAGGLDPRYMFEARPLSFTDKGLFSNYAYRNVSGREKLADAKPKPIPGYDKETLLRSPLTDDLMGHFSDLCVINGIHHNTDIHELNVPNLINGSNAGGDNFVAKIGALRSGILDSISIGEVRTLPFLGTNFSNSVALSSAQNGLNDALMNRALPTEDMTAMQALRTIYRSFGAGTPFGSAVDRLSESMVRMPKLMGRFKNIAEASQKGAASGGSREEIAVPDDLRMAMSNSAVSFLQFGVAGAINLIFDYDQGPQLNLDTHDPSPAQNQVITYRKVVADINHLLNTLKGTWWNQSKQISMFDVTTVLISSEMGRTRVSEREPNADIDKGGTDHNGKWGMAMLAGKGIKGGQVIGNSSMSKVNADGEFTDLLKFHQGLNPDLLKPFGLPFDYNTGETIYNSTMETYDPRQFITIANVISTVQDMFGVSSVDFQRVGGKSAAPIKKVRG